PAWQGIEFWRARLPMPQPVCYSRPEIALTVFKQTKQAGTETAVLAEATGMAVVNRAELRNRKTKARHPYATFTILDKRACVLPANFWIPGQLSVLPADKPFLGSDPERPVTRRDQSHDVAGREILIGRELQGDSP